MDEPLDLDQIKARAAEFDRVESGHHDLGTRYIAACRSASDIAALIAEVDRLRQALLRYGGHGMFCPHDAKFDRGPCNCGWPALKAELVQMKGGA